MALRHHRPAGRVGNGGISLGRPPRGEINLVSVVIPAFNAAATLGAQLDALAAQTYDGNWQVVVSDNGSTDGTGALAASYAGRLPGLRVLDASGRRGPAHARNVGAAAGGDLVAFCDADDVVEPGWLAALVEAAADADIVGGALDHRSLNDPEIVDWRGGGETELPSALAFLPYAISANVAVRQETWRRLGGWDTGYPRASGEDVDFCWRAQLAGFDLAFAPDAVIRYRHRTRPLASARQVYHYAHTGALLYRRFRPKGARRRPVGDVARSYGFLAVRLPYLAMSRRRRGIWLVVAAENLGRIRGSFAHRVFCP